MRLFNCEVFCGSGTYSGAMLAELQKVLRIAIGNMGGLQQGYMSKEEETQLEHELEDNICDLVAALTNKEVTFGPRKEYKGGTNMPGFIPFTVDHETKTIRAGASCMGPGYGRKYIVFLPEAVVNDPVIQGELLSTKPAGFRPDAIPFERDYIKHLSVCQEHVICIQCGRREYDEELAEYKFPYCNLHDPYGIYYRENLPVPVIVERTT